MNTKRPLTIAALTTAAAIFGASATCALTPNQVTLDQQPHIVTRGAIIMLNKPHVHENIAHTSIGNPRIVLTPGRGLRNCMIEVHFDQNPGEKIVNISATPDDKMVAQGITVGTAGGNGRVSIRLYRGGKSVCATNSHIDPAANVWLQTTVLQTGGVS